MTEPEISTKVAGNKQWRCHTCLKQVSLLVKSEWEKMNASELKAAMVERGLMYPRNKSLGKVALEKQEKYREERGWFAEPA